MDWRGRGRPISSNLSEEKVCHHFGKVAARNKSKTLGVIKWKTVYK